MDATVIDRGIDELITVNGKQTRIDKLRGKEVIRLLNSLGVTDISMVSFSEYEKTEQYDKNLI